MDVYAKVTSGPSRCGYLKDRDWVLDYQFVSQLSAEEFTELLSLGWRKFGHALFRNRCPNCNECKAIRVLAREFCPNRSQKRTSKQNQDIEVRIETPDVSPAIIELYMNHHKHHADTIGWPKPRLESAITHLTSMSQNPFPIQLWCHYLGEQLVGACYVDPLPDGYSLVYSFFDPDFRARSLGKWMILSVIERTRSEKLNYAYLGYYVRECRSMSYKSGFLPHEIRNDLGEWERFDRS